MHARTLAHVSVHLKLEEIERIIRPVTQLAHLKATPSSLPSLQQQQQQQQQTPRATLQPQLQLQAGEPPPAGQLGLRTIPGLKLYASHVATVCDVTPLFLPARAESDMHGEETLHLHFRVTLFRFERNWSKGKHTRNWSDPIAGKFKSMY
ncbi:hypothetical protein GUJ93_ZPchr0001g29367 [Zizania palustris]|uniref:Uncharacterized protein n=1 Tax=Zizania palustris TaxID=103762 RepID=A0A8J5VT41_ZIZPA|nr:hypothetical protein GUJ93_ZPchr0001g29367 [Zizania palustris]